MNDFNKGKINILFVCMMNYQRSKTAETLYKKDTRFNIRSAGVAIDAFNRISQENLDWANFIIVMEKNHRNKIRKEFPEIYTKKRIICLYIADEFDYMETALVRLIKHKFENIYASEITKGGLI